MGRSAIEHIVNPPHITLEDEGGTRKPRDPFVTKLQRQRNSKLLDIVKERMGYRSDNQLCKLLEIGPPNLSKVRAGTNGIGAAMAIRIHERSGMSFKEMRKVLGIPGPKPVANDKTPLPHWRGEIRTGNEERREGEAGTPGDGWPTAADAD